MSAERIFRLWAFSDGSLTIITRGETEDQAMQYAARETGSFLRGKTIFPVHELPINAAEMYSLNHSPGWLTRIPVWLWMQEQRAATKIGTDTIVKDVMKSLADRL